MVFTAHMNLCLGKRCALHEDLPVNEENNPYAWLT